MRAEYDTLLRTLMEACRAHYGDRLSALAVFGSVGRGTPRPDSDGDLLIVAEDLPNGRVPRVDDFGAVERAMASEIERARRGGLEPALSPCSRCPASSRTAVLCCST